MVALRRSGSRVLLFRRQPGTLHHHYRHTVCIPDLQDRNALPVAVRRGSEKRRLILRMSEHGSQCGVDSVRRIGGMAHSHSVRHSAVHHDNWHSFCSTTLQDGKAFIAPIRKRSNIQHLRTYNMETFNDVISTNQPVLVDFFATWCGPCKMMHPILEQLKEALGDKLRIIKIDIDKNQAVANQFQIQSVPTMILFKDKKILWRQSGAMPLNALQDVISPFLA